LAYSMKPFIDKLAKFPTQLLIIMIGLVGFVSFIGNVNLFDTIELRFAEYAREMLLSQSFRKVQLNFAPVALTPPLFTWIQTVSFYVFGVNEFAARFPNAIIGVLSMLMAFRIGRYYFSSAFGVFWALLLGSSFLSILYFKSGISDPLGNYLLFLSAYFLFKVSIKDEFAPRKMLNSQMFRSVFYSALFCSLAMLTTGSINFLIIVVLVTIVLLWNKGKITFSISNFVWWLLFQSLFIFLWLNLEDGSWNISKLSIYVKSQIGILATENTSGIRSLPLFIFVLLIGFFPSSFLIWRVLKRNADDTIHQLLLKRWMLSLLLLVFVLIYFHHKQFINQITLAFYPLSFLGAYFLYKLYINARSWKLVDSVILFTGALVWAVAVGGVIYLFSSGQQERLSAFIHSPFWKLALTKSIYWNSYEILLPVVFIAAILVAIILFHLKKNTTAIGVMIVSCMLFFNLSVVLLLPRLSLYSQGTFIAFVKKSNAQFVAQDFESYIPPILFYK
jgi:4-amino-4-deoxy-L-arabinose transferase-like glycosyltransferase